MDIFNFAMQLEEKGEQYYRELAERTKNEVCGNIFNMLAEDEKKHYNVFKNMKEGVATEFRGTVVLDEARKTFADAILEGVSFEPEIEHKDLYKKVLDIERHSMGFYLEKSEEVNSIVQKAIFRKIAGEEEKHFRLIDAFLTFIRHPETFLEDVEFFQDEHYWMVNA